MRAYVIALLVVAACSKGSSGDKEKVAPRPPPAGAWTIEDFNEKISAELEIELSEPTESVGDLSNQKAKPTATIVNVKLTASMFEKDNLRDLAVEELDRIVHREGEIRIRSLTDKLVTHPAPNGRYFTVRDLLAAIEKTERETRGQTNWLGGIDVHHVFFEGLHAGSDGTWTVHWGS
jgi:hypothetical protein